MAGTTHESRNSVGNNYVIIMNFFNFYNSTLVLIEIRAMSKIALQLDKKFIKIC